eukprot:6196334-Pleurochrysis_carterae.AAC.3
MYVPDLIMWHDPKIKPGEQPSGIPGKAIERPLISTHAEFRRQEASHTCIPEDDITGSCGYKTVFKAHLLTFAS